jgi:hypothetical protein
MSLGAGLQLARPLPATKRVLWLAYKAAPGALQRPVAELRRRRRRRAEADHVLGRELSGADRSWLERSIRDMQPAAVVFDSVFALVATPPGVKRVLLLPDLVHERAVSLAREGYTTVPAYVDRDWELARIAGVDSVAAIQWDDARTVRESLPGASVVVAPPALGADVAWQASGRSAAGNLCLFVGNGAIHNVDGVQWMLDRVWPEVRETVPAARLRVVGTVATQVKGRVPGVELVGEVGDIAAEYRAADVVLVPLRVGSGLKVKLVEAICSGRPTVTTAVGAQGLMSIDPRPFVVADGEGAFAQEVITLLRDDAARRRVETAAREARSLFEPSVAHRDFVALLRAAESPAGR